MNKKEFLLQQIIKAYLEHLEPIGSTQLKSMYNIDFSPASIRGYFKKLGDEGYLAQEHISSGRIPTVDALREYWQRRLTFELDNINLAKLKKLCRLMNLTVLIKESNENKLQSIHNIEDTFLILDFGDFRISIKYSAAFARFLNDLIGLEITDIVKISNQVGAYEVGIELSRYLRSSGYEIVNIKPLVGILNDYDFEEDEIKRILNGDILDNLVDGLYFEDLLPIGFMGICRECKVENRDAKVLIMGALSTDFIYFYNNLKGSIYE